MERRAPEKELTRKEGDGTSRLASGLDKDGRGPGPGHSRVWAWALLVFLTNLNINPSYKPASPVLGIYPRQIKTYDLKKNGVF